MNYFEKLFVELERLAKNMILWNNFSYGMIFPKLTEENMEYNIMETYKNMIDSVEDLGEEGNKLGEKIGQYLEKIVDKYSEEEDKEYLKDCVRYVRRERVSMYNLMEYLFKSIEKMKTNYFVLFMEKVVYMDFREVVEDENLLDSLQFIQRLVRIFCGVRDMYFKRRRIMMERMNLGRYISNRRYF